MEKVYDFTARIYKPKGCETLEDFHRIYGTHEQLSHADFDKHSKIDPMLQAFEEIGKEITITGRRADQVCVRCSLCSCRCSACPDLLRRLHSVLPLARLLSL